MDRQEFAAVMERVSTALKKQGGNEDLVEATGILAREAKNPSSEAILAILDKNAPKFEPFFRKKGWWPLPGSKEPSLTDEQILQLIYREIENIAAELRQEAETGG